jgi:coronin-1B/1C/6
MPFFDYDTSMLYLAGKGDGNVRYYEMVEESPYIHFLSDFKSSTPQLGMCFVPKTACNVSECEVAKALKVSNGLVEPIHFTVPRKQTFLFQDDIFPDTAGPNPAMTAGEWLGGANKDPILISLEDGFVPVEREEFKAAEVVEEKKELTEKELREEHEKLTQRVAYLEAELVKRDAKIKELGG